MIRIVHCKKEKYDIYIGRPSKWGNPFIIGQDGNREEIIQKYKVWLFNQPELIKQAKTELKDKILACWCKPLDCHGDVLAKIVNENIYALCGLCNGTNVYNNLKCPACNDGYSGI